MSMRLFWAVKRTASTTALWVMSHTSCAVSIATVNCFAP